MRYTVRLSRTVPGPYTCPETVGERIFSPTGHAGNGTQPKHVSTVTALNAYRSGLGVFLVVSANTVRNIIVIGNDAPPSTGRNTPPFAGKHSCAGSRTTVSVVRTRAPGPFANTSSTASPAITRSRARPVPVSNCLGRRWFSGNGFGSTARTNDIVFRRDNYRVRGRYRGMSVFTKPCYIADDFVLLFALNGRAYGKRLTAEIV